MPPPATRWAKRWGTRCGDALAKVGADASVRGVVLAGRTADTFSAGAPRDLLLKLTRGDLRPSDILLPRLLLDCPVPVIAAMAGHA